MAQARIARGEVMSNGRLVILFVMLVLSSIAPVGAQEETTYLLERMLDTKRVVNARTKTRERFVEGMLERTYAKELRRVKRALQEAGGRLLVAELRRRYRPSAVVGPGVGEPSPPVPAPAVPKVFICHASEDHERAREVHDALKRAGFEPWFDREALAAESRREERDEERKLIAHDLMQDDEERTSWLEMAELTQLDDDDDDGADARGPLSPDGHQFDGLTSPPDASVPDARIQQRDEEPEHERHYQTCCQLLSPCATRRTCLICGT